MYGFKSFVHKMVFEFDEGITAIVGPNGSGKSNIADAVRWVLGEQSAKLLRGTKMQDVIFAGTETRKPLGYCQVDLTIDNSDLKMSIDYSEVTVSRKVYRSGESEYSINGTECRLKDISELFMDTGVGKEGYSIIGQGQIDKILSSKPDDRRELFDEAAGIVKFKKRKMTAEKNLEEEKQNLIRLNDIIRELQGQEATLKKQSAVAKEYLDLKERLKKYEVNIFINESDKLNESIDEIKKKDIILKDHIDGLREENQGLKLQYNECHQEIEKLELKINEYKEAQTESTLKKGKQENRISLIQEQMTNLHNHCLRMETSNEGLINKLEGVIKERDEYAKKLEELSADYEAKEIVLNKQQNELDSLQQNMMDNEQAIDQIQGNRIERLNEITNVKTKIQRYSTMLENIEERRDVLSIKREASHKEHQKGNLLLQDKQIELKNHFSQQKKADEEKLFLTEEIQNKENELHKLKASVKEKSNELNMIQSRYKALDDIKESYEGYTYSVKKIMELKKAQPKQYQGILGAVADLIKVDEDYETAIEIALGSSVQNIVTDNEETAKGLINYLKTSKLGRATFLPLTGISNKNFQRTLTKKEVGFIGYASDLVKCKAEFKNIIGYLLGRIVVVDHLENAISLARKYHYSFKIVTLTGDVISPGGSMTGGAFKNKGNQFLARKRELEELNKKSEQVFAEVSEGKSRVIQLDIDLENQKEEMEALKKKEHEISISVNGLNLIIGQLEREHQSFLAQLQDIDSELDQLSKQEIQIKDALKDMNEALDGSELENIDDENKVKLLNEEIQYKKQSIMLLSEQLTNIKVESSAVKQQLESTRANEDRLNQSAKEYEKQIEENLKEIEDGKATIEEREKEKEELEKALENIHIHILDLQEKIEELTKKRFGVSEKQQRIYSLREEKTEELNLLEKDSLRLQNNLEKLEIQKNNQLEYMWDEYELTLNNARIYKDVSLGSSTQIKRAINDLKGSIKSLGDVNVNSIEEYKTVYERYIFLSEQRADLIKAEEQLKSVIEDLNEQMIKQFKVKFKEISAKFNDVFRELFGGGKALLELSEDENILEAGIELIAQPPGKKLQSMRLLSGGEKAFTAIALLFAIQSLKPSPFCILDEIEAALDDVNVVRFAKYLEKLSVNTQFIIITHRRGTMEAADVLYGITMQEKGISTQVSVKLLENELQD